jgi:hypothetical protein
MTLPVGAGAADAVLLLLLPPVEGEVDFVELLPQAATNVTTPTTTAADRTNGLDTKSLTVRRASFCKPPRAACDTNKKSQLTHDHISDDRRSTTYAIQADSLNILTTGAARAVATQQPGQEVIPFCTISYLIVLSAGRVCCSPEAQAAADP